MPRPLPLMRPAGLLALLLPLALTACQSAVGVGPPDKQPPGALAPELVGVWQESVATAGDYVDDDSGTTFTMTSGYNAVLKLRPDGEYYLSFYAAGVAQDCAFVSHLDQSVGAATFEGSTLTLTPNERRLDITDCGGERTRALANDPLAFEATLAEGFDFNGLKVRRLELDGDLLPLNLTVLHQEPSETVSPERPDDFVQGDGEAVTGLTGTWTSSAGAPLDFYDPITGAFDLPGEGEFDYQYFRIDGAEYELARTWTEYDVTGVCQKDYVYFERGMPTFAQTVDIYGDGEYRIGHARLAATTTDLLVQIRECGDDDGVLAYGLAPVTNYYQWDLSAAGENPSEDPAMLILSCPWEQSEWQFMVCGGFDRQTNYFAWD